jgi:ABC-2 type transport system ATP-binding protein
MDCLVVRDVEKKYIDQYALKQVNMKVPENSIYGLLGPNGAGKTTLIRIINRITAPDHGQILYKGRKIKLGDVFHIGYLPEERGLYKKMKVGEQALYLAQLKGMSKRDAVQKLKYWFEKFEIQGWWEKKVEELSKGMQQKLQFIATVIHEPELLIFDEPFSGFDPINTKMLKNEVKALQKKGATIIFSTHNMSSVEELCDHITLINKAESILQGSMHAIRDRYKANIYIIEYKGNPDQVRASLNNHYKILEHESIHDSHVLRVKIQHGSAENELLSSLIPVAEVLSFREEIPSMNDIFINVVNEYQT